MNLEDFGWSHQLQNQLDSLEQPSLIAARVIRSNHAQLTVHTASGELAAHCAGTLDSRGGEFPAVAGDWVALDLVQGSAVVRAILPRRGILARRRPGRAEQAQVVATNIDLVILVESLDRGPNPRRIERGVALAYGSGAIPVVVLSKVDTGRNLAEALQMTRAAAPFADIIATSSATGTGLDELTHFLNRGCSAVLLGPSGAGKSSLINALLGSHELATAAVRASDAKGRHTTTSSQLVMLPSGACIVDTPGIRELGLWLSVETVDSAFPDIEGFASQCRFRDCEHAGEPGCAVASAVARGELDEARVGSYRKLRREAEQHELRHDASLNHQRRARERSFAKLCRAEMKRKRRER